MRFPVDAIYFISLPKAAQRRKKLLSHFTDINLTDKFGNEPTWQIASDGNHVSHLVDNRLKKLKKRSNLSLSEIGCCASHREVWKKMLDKGQQLIMILEDDSRFDIDKANLLLDSWDKLPEFDFLHLGWNYYAGYGKQTIEPVDCIEGLELWKGNQMWLTHGYIINQEAAQLLLDNTNVQTNGLDAMTAWIQDHMESYGFRPHVVFQAKDLQGHQRSQIHHTG